MELFSKLQLTDFKYDGCHLLPKRAKLTSYFMKCELKNVAIKRLEKENVEKLGVYGIDENSLVFIYSYSKKAMNVWNFD